MTQGTLGSSTKSNTEGRVTVVKSLPKARDGRGAAQGQDAKDDSNPRHYEDFNRLLGGMARSSS